MNIEDHKLLIFDLDGTLYEDTDHFEYHAKNLQQKLPVDKQEAFWKEYQEMLEGKHSLTIGSVYDTRNDVILTIDPETYLVQEVREWSGEKWDVSQVQKEYSNKVLLDFSNFVAIGDGWWLPFANAIHYGLTTDDTYESYVKTKEYMVSEQFQLTITPGLKEQLREWGKERTLVLLTNSEAYDVNNLLTSLQLQDVFDEVVPSAMKPNQTEYHFTNMMEKWQVSSKETISIGDNFINEIAPAVQLGMKAILINSASAEVHHPYIQVISSMQEICNTKSSEA